MHLRLQTLRSSRVQIADRSVFEDRPDPALLPLISVVIPLAIWVLDGIIIRVKSIVVSTNGMNTFYQRVTPTRDFP